MTAISGFQFSWTLATWELPLDTAEARRAARLFLRRLNKYDNSLLSGNSRRGTLLMTVGGKGSP
jgi:hypothetical protein